MGKKGKGKAKARVSGPVKSSSGPGKATASLATTVSEAPFSLNPVTPPRAHTALIPVIDRQCPSHLRWWPCMVGP